MRPERAYGFPVPRNETSNSVARQGDAEQGSTARVVVERYLAEVENGDDPDLADLVASEELRQRVRSLRAAFPDLRIQTVVLLSENDLVAGHFIARGTHRGLFQGVPTTGQAWEAHCTAVYRVENDRIAEAWVTWDHLSLMEQLGAIRRVQTVSA